MTSSSLPGDPTAPVRRWAYILLTTLAAGLAAGRILSAQLVYEPSQHQPFGPRIWPAKTPQEMPIYGSNDRARWAAIRALVDEGTYAVGRRVEVPPLGQLDNASVQAVRAVRLLGDGARVSCPGILGPTPLAPPIYLDDGIIFRDGYTSVDKVLDPKTKLFHSSKPPLLVTVLAGEYWLLKNACGWTMQDHPFEVVRTVLFTVNWLPLVIYLLLFSRLVERFGVGDWDRLFVMAAACLGTFLTTFLTTLNNHTVAAFSVLFAAYPLVRIWVDGRREGWRFALAGFFGAWAACTELPAAVFGVALFLLLAVRDFRRTLVFFVPAALIPMGAFLLTNYLVTGSIVPVQVRFGSEWYLYEGSHWRNPRGIDAADEPKHVYAFHLTLGHHGFFSLSPIFLLSLLGMAQALWSRQRLPAMVAGLTALVSAVVFGFYVDQTTNYGGWTAGPRWLFWLIPLWLLALLPAACWLGRSRAGRALGYVLLALSALSAAYPAWNPWRHPWLYNLLEYVGLVSYR